MLYYLIDSNALIYSANPAPAYDRMRDLLTDSLAECAASAISMVEVLGFPRLTARDQLVLEATFEALTMMPVTAAIIGTAIDLGRNVGLRAADAIIAASALEAGCMLVSADTHFLRVPGLTVLHPLTIISR